MKTTGRSAAVGRYVVLAIVFAASNGVRRDAGDERAPGVAPKPFDAAPAKATGGREARSFRPRRRRVERNPEAGEADASPVAERWLYKIRAFPHLRIPRGARVRAFEQLRRMSAPESVRAGTAGNGQQASGGWTLIGPQPEYPGNSGRVTALAVDPRDNNTVFIGGAEGGVWKTMDAGTSWTPLTDTQPALAIGALAIDPSNSQIVYAGTGEGNFNGDAYGGAGVLKTVDGGRTWTLLASDMFDQMSFLALAVSPRDGRILLAAVPLAGVYRSADGGATWQNVLPGEGDNVFFDPSNSNVAYAAMGGIFGTGTGIFKSIDAGVTWKASNGTGTTVLPPANAGRANLAIAPSSPKTLYASFENTSNGNSTLTALYTSANGGQTWTEIAGAAYCTKQCWYNDALAVSPSDAKTLVAGGVDLMISTNGGMTWSTVQSSASVHVDQHAVAFTGDGSKVYVGNDGGVWSATEASSAFTWTNLNETLALAQFYGGVSTHPTDPTVTFGGTQDNGTLQYAGTPVWAYAICGDGGATAIDPVNPKDVYAACGGVQPAVHYSVVWKSNQGGVDFQPAEMGISGTEGVPFIPYLTIDPTNPQNLYLTGTRHIYQTTDWAATWALISPDVTADVFAPCAIAVAPSDSNTVYTGSCDGVAQVTSNALSGKSSTWTNISPGLPGNAIAHITVDPSSAKIAYATLLGFQAGHVYSTSDGGQTWKNISANLPDIPANDLVVDPDLAGTLYVATDLGVFWTNTYGRTWSELGSGLPRAAVLSLNLQRSSRTLRAATHGRSVWDLPMPLDGLNRIPEIDGAAPAQIALGSGGASLTVSGRDFAPSSVVLWNGQPRAAAFVSASEVRASLTAADVASDGLAAVSVFTPAPGGGTSGQVYVKVGTNPAVYPTGILNAASYAAGSGVAPGSIVSVFGVDFATGLSLYNSATLPSSLGGASLEVMDAAAGVNLPAPMFYVSPGQMNVQIPWETAPGDATTLQPILSGAAGGASSVTIQFFAPGIFTVDQSGGGQGSVTNAATGRLAAETGKYPSAQPIRRGEYISIYCTGLGYVDNPPPDGAPAPAKPLANTYFSPIVTIGSAQANVTFSGLAPGFIGLNQVNAQVPTNAPTGSAVPLAISDGIGDNSNTVTIAIE